MSKIIKKGARFMDSVPDGKNKKILKNTAALLPKKLKKI